MPTSRSLRPSWMTLLTLAVALGPLFLPLGCKRGVPADSAQAAGPATPSVEPKPEPVPAPPPDIAPLVTLATSQLGARRFDEALLTARDAARQAPTDYRAPYYEALAHFGLERYAEAEVAAARALSLAPPDATAAVNKLQTAIATRRQGAETLAAAEAAATEGLGGKAGRLYEQAWQADPRRTEAALKAAELYRTSLDEPVAAGKILRRLIATSPEARDAAQTQLDKIAPTLRQRAEADVARAKTAPDFAAQMRLLTRAEEADPEFDQLWRTKAAIVSKSGTCEELQDVFRALVRLKLFDIQYLSELPGLNRWIEDPAFQAFLPDLLGAGQIAELTTKTRHPFQHALITVPETDVEILVDDRAVGFGGPQLRVADLPPGEHKLTLVRKNTDNRLSMIFPITRGTDDITITYSMDAFEAKPSTKHPWKIPGLGVELIAIDRGVFIMGTSPDNPSGESNERPTRVVKLTKPYWLGRTEVTQAQWRALMGNNPSYTTGDDLPVTHVRWYDALGFCGKLNERERAAGRLPDGYAYTLPTEAQWEYACRAGGEHDANYAGDLDAMAWYKPNSGNQLHPVGQKQANAWGLHDMHGNGWEWCLDRYGAYYDAIVDEDPTGPSSGSHGVIRGGAYGTPARLCRSAFRDGFKFDEHSHNLGFRVALSVVR